MDKLVVSQTFLIGLSAYANQLQLSIDRSTWFEFCNYAKSIRPFIEVLNAIEVEFCVNTSNIKRRSFNRKNNSKFKKLFLKNGMLTKDEREYIYQSFLRLYEAINTDEKIPDHERIEFRMGLLAASNILDERLSTKNNLSNLVEHFNQSEVRKTKSINEIVGRPWP